MSPKSLPPGPAGTLIGGNFSEMSRDWLDAYTRYARTFGDVVAYRMGPFRSVLVSHPAMIEELLVTQASQLRKSSIQQLIRPLIGNGTFLMEGDPWKRRRRLVAPVFQRQQIAFYGEAMVQLTSRLVSDFREGEIRDIHRDMTRLAMRIVSRTLFDADLDDSLSGVELALEGAIRALTARLEATVPLPIWIPSPGVLGLRAARRDLDGVIDGFIRRRRGELGETRDLLSRLLAARDADTGEALTDREVRDEAVTIFLAGFETTAITLAWTFWLLARHPDVTARLQTEVDTVLQRRAATPDDLPKLKLAENIVLEVMRLYPPAWIMGRQATTDLEIGTHRVPKGWGIEICQWVVHRDPRFWPRPESFDPDRWANGLVSRLPRFTYFPFGGGPRVCAGNGFAMMELTLVLSTIAAEVSLEPVNEVNVLPDPGFTLRPASALSLRVRRRAS